MQLDEQTYVNAAASELNRLMHALDALGGDLEVELANDILSIEFSETDKCIINSHRAARQIWLAAQRRAWHFDLNADGSWRATKTGDELWTLVEGIVSTGLGRAVQLSRAS